MKIFHFRDIWSPRNPNLVIYSKSAQFGTIYSKSPNSCFGETKYLHYEKFFQKSVSNIFLNTIECAKSAGQIRAAPPQLAGLKVLPRQQIRIFANFAKGIPMYQDLARSMEIEGNPANSGQFECSEATGGCYNDRYRQ